MLVNLFVKNPMVQTNILRQSLRTQEMFLFSLLLDLMANLERNLKQMRRTIFAFGHCVWDRKLNINFNKI